MITIKKKNKKGNGEINIEELKAKTDSLAIRSILLKGKIYKYDKDCKKNKK